ncbi:RHS repeat-associated core domain-containing protein [Chitinophaga sp. CF418]|nr:RHS repeat-associated core domain-containing protein [Chitinophaga sp. CF418]
MKGEGNQQDYGLRVYDLRLGRFLSVDPLTPKYPELTPYQFSGNTPIQATDLDGAETFIQRQGNANRDYARINTAKAEQIRIKSESWRYREPEIAIPDIYGNGHIGPASIVRQNVAAIKNEHDDAVAAAISGGPFGAAGYLWGGDQSALKWSTADGVMVSFGGIPADGASVFPQMVKGQSATNIAYTETGASAGKQINAIQFGSYRQAERAKLNYKIEGNMIGGEIVYPDGKINDFLAYRNVFSDGKTLELTTFILYPRGVPGNELKNEFGREAMLETLELFMQDAKEHKFDNFRIQFERAKRSSSAKPGKVVDVTIDLNKK